jgi:hypothetical protein
LFLGQGEREGLSLAQILRPTDKLRDALAEQLSPAWNPVASLHDSFVAFGSWKEHTAQL